MRVLRVECVQVRKSETAKIGRRGKMVNVGEERCMHKCVCVKARQWKECWTCVCVCVAHR